MVPSRVQESGSVYARLSRFALCIAPSSGLAYDAVAHVEFLDQGQEPSDEAAFRALLEYLDDHAAAEVNFSGQAPNSLVARFSFLPYPQRVAFALVVIEEFSVPRAAAVMGLQEEDVRSLLLATRDFLFANRWTVLGDA